MSGRFDDGFVQAVRDAVDLVDLVADQTKVEKKGSRYQALCPFHKEKTPSFSIDSDQGLFYCFGCGAGGDAIGFHIRITGDDFPTAIEALARRYGIAVPEGESSDGRDPRTDDRVLGLAARFFVAELDRSEKALTYLGSRAIPRETIDDFDIGYAPDQWQALTDALSERVPVAELERAGLVARSDSGRVYDRFRDRLMFPIRTPAGRLVGFGGRTLGDDRAKYINTRETPSFQKSSLLYGLDRAKSAIREHRRVLLVEGYFDVIGSVLSGIDWVVASMGTSLTAQQIRILKRYADEVVVGYDGDRAGEEASRKVLRALLAQGLVPRRARFPAGQDPDSLRQDEGPEAVHQLVEQAPDAIELEIARLPRGLEDEPRLQSQQAAAIRELLAAVPDPVLRFGYGKKAADRIGLPEEVLWRLRVEPESRQREVDEPERVSDVTSLEEHTLQLLLSRPLPPPDPPPSPESFFDSRCRSIFVAYLEAASRAEPGATLSAAEILRGLEGESQAIDRVAGLLLEESFGGETEEELAECLERLDVRWKRRRSGQLKRELLEAQKAGDSQRLSELLEQKLELSRVLHARRDI